MNGPVTTARARKFHKWENRTVADVEQLQQDYLGRIASADLAGLEEIRIAALGKQGARELNYVSDVDVIFVGGTADEEALSEPQAIDIATPEGQSAVPLLRQPLRDSGRLHGVTGQCTGYRGYRIGAVISGAGKWEPGSKSAARRYI